MSPTELVVKHTCVSLGSAWCYRHRHLVNIQLRPWDKKMGQHWQAHYYLWKRVYTFLKPLQQSLKYGKLMVKNECQGSEYVLPLGAHPTTVHKCVWTGLKEEYGSWKGIDFYEDRCAQWRHLPSVPVHRDKKPAKHRQQCNDTTYMLLTAFCRNNFELPSRFSHGDFFEWRCSFFFCCFARNCRFPRWSNSKLSLSIPSVAQNKKVGRDMNTHLRRRSYAPHQTAP